MDQPPGARPQDPKRVEVDGANHGDDLVVAVAEGEGPSDDEEGNGLEEILNIRVRQRIAAQVQILERQRTAAQVQILER